MKPGNHISLFSHNLTSCHLSLSHFGLSLSWYLRKYKIQWDIQAVFIYIYMVQVTKYTSLKLKRPVCHFPLITALFWSGSQCIWNTDCTAGITWYYSHISTPSSQFMCQHKVGENGHKITHLGLRLKVRTLELCEINARSPFRETEFTHHLTRKTAFSRTCRNFRRKLHQANIYYITTTCVHYLELHCYLYYYPSPDSLAFYCDQVLRGKMKNNDGWIK